LGRFTVGWAVGFFPARIGMRYRIVVNDTVELGKPLIPAPGQLADARILNLARD
jgi:hypothetical protein